MTEEELDRMQEEIDKFQVDFKKLVRKHMPKYPESEYNHLKLMRMQESTSCYNPYVWY